MCLLLLILSAQVIMINSVPLLKPFVIPPLPVQPPLPLLQEELLRLQSMQQPAMPLQSIPALQQLQQAAMQQQPIPAMLQQPEMQQPQPLPELQQLIPALHHLQPMAMPMNQIQPIILLLPGLRNPMSDNMNNVNLKLNKKGNDKKEHKETDEDLESVMIEAENIEPIPTIDDQKAILLMPNPRISINSIISAIPFLPFEINVPDTIAWMYNGIISIIGQIQNLQGNRLRFKHFGDFGNVREQLRPIIVIPL